MLREWKRIEYYYSLHVKYVETPYKHVICVYVEGGREKGRKGVRGRDEGEGEEGRKWEGVRGREGGEEKRKDKLCGK